MDRLKAWFISCVQKAVERLPFAGRYRYSVVSCDFDAQTLDLSPLDPGQPSMTKVPMRTPGLMIDLAPGAEVLVGYAGMNRTLPEVTSFTNDPTAILRVKILGQGTPVALQGMAVQVTVPVGAILTTGSSTAQSGPSPAQGPVTLDGEITEGSAVIFGG